MLVGTLIAYAGGWSLWRPLSFSLPHSELFLTVWPRMSLTNFFCETSLNQELLYVFNFLSLKEKLVNSQKWVKNWLSDFCNNLYLKARNFFLNSFFNIRCENEIADNNKKILVDTAIQFPIKSISRPMHFIETTCKPES